VPVDWIEEDSGCFMQDFRNLDVWQNAHQLTLEVYNATRAMPPEERYGLTSQLRRAATSIPANIAEGCGRQSDADFRRFLHNAMGSASELESDLLITHDLRLLDDTTFETLTTRLTSTKRMLNALIQRLGPSPRSHR
jgi:four helix bundle protein